MKPLLNRVGVRGNGPMMMLEKNSDEIAGVLERLVRQNVK